MTHVRLSGCEKQNKISMNPVRILSTKHFHEQHSKRGHCPKAHGNHLSVGLDQIPFLFRGTQNRVLFILCQL